MQAMVTSVVLFIVFVGLMAAIPIAYAGWRRLVTREGDLQIWRVMRRRGIAPEDATGQEPKLAKAIQRCVMCPSIEDCDQWLASGNREGLGLFCPNATFLNDMRRQKESGSTR